MRSRHGRYGLQSEIGRRMIGRLEPWSVAITSTGGNAKSRAMKAPRENTAPPNWAPALMFLLTSAVALTGVPWYGLLVGYHTVAWVWFALLLGANGMAVTCGYHRLFSHATYEAHRRSRSSICCSVRWHCRTAR